MIDDYEVQIGLDHGRYTYPVYVAFCDAVGTDGEGSTPEKAVADFWKEVAYDIKDFQRKPAETLSAVETEELGALLELCRRNGKEGA